MKVLKLIFLFGLINISLNAQETNIESIPVGVFIPQQQNIPSTGAAQLLESRLQQALTVAGIGGSDSNINDFILYPIVNFVTEELTAGSPTMYIQNQDVTIFLSSHDGTKVYGSCNVNLKGAGISQEKAFLIGIRNLNPRNKELQNMLKEAKLKMLRYYEENCNVILAQAEALSSHKKYGEAISLLYHQPKLNNSCFFEGQSKIDSIYKKMEKNACADWLHKAETAIANHSFKDAAYYLMQIPPTSDCSSEVKAAIDKLENYHNYFDERQWTYLKQSYNDSVALEAQRIDAKVAIATAFAQILAAERNQNAQDIILNTFELD